MISFRLRRVYMSLSLFRLFLLVSTASLSSHSSRVYAFSSTSSNLASFATSRRVITTTTATTTATATTLSVPFSKRNINTNTVLCGSSSIPAEPFWTDNDYGNDGNNNNNNNGNNTLPSVPTPTATKKITASDVQQISVTTVDGTTVTLGELMMMATTMTPKSTTNADSKATTTTSTTTTSTTTTTSIVVFLRHLGCFHCWSYAREWIDVMKEQQERLSKTDHPPNDDDSNNNNKENATVDGIVGPIFISIGDPDRLTAFLQHHPEIPSSQIAVDGYDFDAYRKAGFGRMDTKEQQHQKQSIATSSTNGVSPRPVRLGGWKGWWTFLTNFLPLAPVTPDMTFPEMFAPEGLMWLGGTMILQRTNRDDENNDDDDDDETNNNNNNNNLKIVYRWDDRIPGDYPNAKEVWDIAQQAAAAAAAKKSGHSG
ncbi:hypothetical protein IV203_020131 [Nitzschia inconspicua]|uniref:Uncharacterized protein n=1 Tax=Nitzschia inconspicua TaxID=303405 RepID=A0A9K3Q5R2_9STRA|nr:hypothetical protein IV203_020131 [Nitzschia inconspicua]